MNILSYEIFVLEWISSSHFIWNIALESIFHIKNSPIFDSFLAMQTIKMPGEKWFVTIKCKVNTKVFFLYFSGIFIGSCSIFPLFSRHDKYIWRQLDIRSHEVKCSYTPLSILCITPCDILVSFEIALFWYEIFFCHFYIILFFI